MTDLNTFREETRAWLEENCPPAMREPVRNEKDICWGGRKWSWQSEDQRLWLERMASRGWTAPTWPAQYGGGGLDRAKAKILEEETNRLGARMPLFSFGIAMLGPALLKFGNEEQKQRFIPPILRGETRWCQGYSEPNAGSDLASLQTRAEDMGDHFLVNGQKIWASYADKADLIFCLVRTSNEGKPQQGISFVLFDMESEGVSTRPIKLISGNSPFCEIFFDNVKVPKANLIGEINKGWTIAKYLLTHEREMVGTFGLEELAGCLGRKLVEKTGKRHDMMADTMLRSRVAEYDLDAACFALTMERIRDEVKAGQSLGAVSSVLKYYGTELNKRRLELSMAASGSDALAWPMEEDPNDAGALCREWLRSKANSIEGGTSEIQLNIIARHVLGLV